MLPPVTVVNAASGINEMQPPCPAVEMLVGAVMVDIAAVPVMWTRELVGAIVVAEAMAVPTFRAMVPRTKIPPLFAVRRSVVVVPSDVVRVAVP
jgi:hypothetical protein